MNRVFPAHVTDVGSNMVTVAGSYLHSVVDGPWDACEVCALPLVGYQWCPQCKRHRDSDLPLADRVGLLVYAVKPESQTYKVTYGYKDALTRQQFEPVVQGLLAVGLRGHFGCASALAQSSTSGWAVVPSTRGRSVLADLVRSLARTASTEVKIEFAGVKPDRVFSPEAWEIAPDAGVPDHVIVIDDSWVTGASAQSVACVLKQAGAKQVSILVVARVLSHDWEPNRAFVRERLPVLPYDWRVCPWTRGECPE